MPNSLPELETERSKILRQFATLGDLRPGSICAVPRRCGKPTCHCAKPNDPGHDPQIRLTRKVDGRTVAESFAGVENFQPDEVAVRVKLAGDPLRQILRRHRRLAEDDAEGIDFGIVTNAHVLAGADHVEALRADGGVDLVAFYAEALNEEADPRPA